MYITEYTKPDNKALLFLLPGQTLSPRAFWDFKLPDGKTHSKYFLEAGIDVILFDPVGFGQSKDFFSYNRLGFAEQINSVTKSITKSYLSKTILGFCSTTAPALISSQNFFNRIIVHSPILAEGKRDLIEHPEIFKNSMDKLKSERLAKVSDSLIPKPNRLDCWEESILEIIGSNTWQVPAQVVADMNNYWILHKTHGFDPALVPATMLSIKGEYDVEATMGYDLFLKTFPNSQEVTIPNSTHFSMWENECGKTRDAIIKFCLKDLHMEG